MSKKAKVIKGIKITVCVVCIAVLLVAGILLFPLTGKKHTQIWSAGDTFDAQKIQTVSKDRTDFKILLFTDTQLWSDLGKNKECYAQMDALVEKTNPDLIVLPGDVLSAFASRFSIYNFIKHMDSYKIPWAPVFGNHDYEGRADKAKLAEIYESAEHCLFKSGPAGMNGMGNYIVNIERNNEVVYSLFLFDDGQYRVVDGQITDGGIGENQIAWYKWAVNGIKETSGKAVPNMAFMHVAVPEYLQFEDDFLMGMRSEGTCTAKVNDGFFDAFKENGGTHMFAGHDHNNNFVTEYEGVKMAYMTKSSYNCYFTSKALGGTLLTLDKNNNVNIEIKDF